VLVEADCPSHDYPSFTSAALQASQRSKPPFADGASNGKEKPGSQQMAHSSHENSRNWQCFPQSLASHST
jgi:hypothetical protein